MKPAPDVTFKGSTLAGWHVLGQADWRAEKTADGMKGVYVSLSDGDIGSYEVRLDAQGKELSRTRLGPTQGPLNRMSKARPSGAEDLVPGFSKPAPDEIDWGRAHAAAADINRDGIPGFIVGKRHRSHLDTYLDPDPNGPAVLYWYRTVRNPKAEGGAEFVPELIHNRSGVGSHLIAVDLNRDGAVEIVTSTTRETHIFWGKPRAAKKVVSKK